MLVSAAQQQDTGRAHPRVIDSIARSPIDAEFEQSAAQRLRIAEVTDRKPIKYEPKSSPAPDCLSIPPAIRRTDPGPIP
jgi:hypothetical protein